ncbi:MAG: flagellar biosynthesis anti-sigma factor FlgM [bacterium]
MPIEIVEGKKEGKVMTMTPIEPIFRLPEIQKLIKPEGEKRTERASAKGGDEIVISSGARKAQRLQRDVSIAQTAANSAPDVRQDRVAEAREKLENGAYLEEQIAEAIAEKIVQGMGF